MNTSVEVPDKLIEVLDKLAEKRMASRSQIIRQAIKEHLDRAEKAGEVDA